MVELQKILAGEGAVFELSGNRPLPLGNSSKVWIVRDKFVDVFFVSDKGGGEGDGARSHLLRAQEGEILLGIDPIQGLGALIGVGGANAKVVEIDLTRLLELAKAPELRGEVASLLDRWLAQVSGSFKRQKLPPRDPGHVSPGQTMSLEDGEKVFASEELTDAGRCVWVRLTQGDVSYLENPDFPTFSSPTTFPLAKKTWIKALGPVALQGIRTEDLIDQDALLELMSSFHATLMACLRAQDDKSVDEDRNRVKRKTDADHALVRNVLLDLGMIMKPRGGRSAFHVNAARPMQAACQMVGEAAGIRVTPSPSRDSTGLPSDRLRDISRASRFRTREVMMSQDWWRKDNGPLLGFLEEGLRPVALIPNGARRYDMVDPVDGTATRVTSKTARLLAPSGHMFYRPFPDERMSGWDLLKYGIRGCWRDIVTVLLMGFSGALLGLLLPWMTGLFFDTYIPEAARSELLQMSLLLVVCALAKTMFDITKSIALLRIEGRIDSATQAALWDRLLALPVPFFRAFTAGDLARRSMGINQIRMILSGVAVHAVLSFIFSFAYLALLFACDWKLAILGIGIVGAGFACVLILSLFQVRHQRTIMNAEGDSAGLILQLITGVAKLRVAGAEDRAFASWARTFAQQRSASFKAGALRNGVELFNAIFPILASMGIFAWVVYMGSSGLSTGKFLAFISAFVSFQNAMLQLAMIVVETLNVFPLYERLRPIIEEQPEVDESKAIPSELSGAIEVNQVNFRYSEEGPMILKDVTLSMAPGEFVAVVGSSGSGKSTLFRILLGFEQPESGTVYYDGQDLASTDVRELRQQMGVVLQNASIMQGSIFENIVGASGLTIEAAWEAARMAGLEEDIQRFPMGMHTVLSAGGGTLSGGQRQRLVIARAIVKKPRILFFDEATSALDNRTQAIVSRSLEGLRVTRIVVAHRLSTIVNADRIYVMDKGQIVERGTYDELMQAKGLFATLAARQIA